MKKTLATVVALVFAVLVGVALGQTVDVTISVPSAIFPDLRDAYLAKFQYQAQVPNPNYCPQEQFDEGFCAPLDPAVWIPNPETQNQFVRRMFLQDIKDTYISYMELKAADVAGTTAKEQAEIDADGITVN